MFIRRTTIKSRESGEPYYTYRLVESVRMGQTGNQQTVLNLGRQFEVPRAQWPDRVRLLHNSEETTSGWQQVNFATPAALKADSVYVISYHAQAGRYV